MVGKHVAQMIFIPLHTFTAMTSLTTFTQTEQYGVANHVIITPNADFRTGDSDQYFGEKVKLKNVPLLDFYPKLQSTELVGKGTS